MKKILLLLTLIVLLGLMTDQIANKLCQKHQMEMVVDGDSTEEENSKSGRIKAKFKDLCSPIALFTFAQFNLLITNHCSHLIIYLDFKYDTNRESDLFILFHQLKICPVA